MIDYELFRPIFESIKRKLKEFKGKPISDKNLYIMEGIIDEELISAKESGLIDMLKEGIGINVDRNCYNKNTINLIIKPDELAAWVSRENIFVDDYPELFRHRPKYKPLANRDGPWKINKEN
jgi:hypothetical protein